MRRVLLALLVLSLLPLSWSSTAQAQDIQYEVTDLIAAHKDPAFIQQGSGAVAIEDWRVHRWLHGRIGDQVKSVLLLLVDKPTTRQDRRVWCHVH